MLIFRHVGILDVGIFGLLDIGIFGKAESDLRAVKKIARRRATPTATNRALLIIWPTIDY